MLLCDAGSRTLQNKFLFCQLASWFALPQEVIRGSRRQVEWGGGVVGRKLYFSSWLAVLGRSVPAEHTQQPQGQPRLPFVTAHRAGSDSECPIRDEGCKTGPVHQKPLLGFVGLPRWLRDPDHPNSYPVGSILYAY